MLHCSVSPRIRTVVLRGATEKREKKAFHFSEVFIEMLEISWKFFFSFTTQFSTWILHMKDFARNKRLRVKEPWTYKRGCENSHLAPGLPGNHEARDTCRFVFVPFVQISGRTRWLRSSYGHVGQSWKIVLFQLVARKAKIQSRKNGSQRCVRRPRSAMKLPRGPTAPSEWETPI